VSFCQVVPSSPSDQKPAQAGAAKLGADDQRA
jgi:hypothetical protein